MQSHDIAVSSTGVLFVRGFGSAIRVDRGHLAVRTVAGRDVSQLRISKIDEPRLKRLIVFGTGGYATWEALSWLDGVGASFICMKTDGTPIAGSARPGPDQAALRRAQARSDESDVGIQIAQLLLMRKVEGQASVMESLPRSEITRSRLDRETGRIEASRDIRSMLAAEASAAVDYWDAWDGLTIRFAQVDLGRIPERWLRFNTRSSGLGTSPRSATHPVNTILNYLYALAEFEAKIALLTHGLDPGLGWFHRDTPYRDSAALDLLEAIRPDVDQFVLELLGTRTFSRRDFRERPNGCVRLAPSLARMLAEASLPTWRAVAIASADEVASLVAGDASSPVRIRRHQARPNSMRGRRVRSACRRCGSLLTSPDRMICDSCLPAYEAEKTETIAAAGRRTLAAMRASDDDPARSPDAIAKERETSREKSLAMRAWEREHGRGDPEVYEREILPRIRELTVPQLMRLTGLSQFHCWKVRKGDRRLHARHWGGIIGAAHETS
ncbi:MAG: CRISPR-associated endonuclease Cas1 [Actinomycetota bacterium]